MKRMRRTQLVLRVSIGAGILLALAGAWFYLNLSGKRAERDAYAAVRAGPSCRSTAERPAYLAGASLKTVDFGGARFSYIRGDADCQTVRPGRWRDDGERAYCVFDRPGYVEVQERAARAHYVVPAGQASVLLAENGPYCAIQPSP